MPEDKIEAPFTPEQVTNINNWQFAGVVHPFTCMSPDIAKCERRNEISQGILIAHAQGFVCPCGEYTQTWCHDYMADFACLARTKALVESMKAGFNPLKSDI